MTSRKRRTPAQERAIREHRDALQAVKTAVARWAAKDEGRRDAIAAAVIERLGECATDTDGDDTLEVVSQLFEEYVEVMSHVVAHAVGMLAKAAHALGRVQKVHLADED